MKKLPKNTAILQTLQNNMIRVILDAKRVNHINMSHVRENLKMMSVNQMAVYHTLLESYNIMRNSSSDQIQRKWLENREKNYPLRNVAKNEITVPEKPISKCAGFTYHGAKLYNMLPKNLRENRNPDAFKNQTKKWIWLNIPSH